ncbi:MAG: endonuclease domain-containing protein [Flavobacteriaceae bacterium]|nr:endonuclease domain-containing protein [Flavobacteriaceae bacterium]
MKRKIINYKPYLKKLARKLRNNSTKAERRLWKRLKGKQMLGYDFHRQKPLLNYIADFYCHELKLVLECDGYSHNSEEAQAKDRIREKALESVGLKVMRFDDRLIMNDISEVLRQIECYVEGFEER